MKYYFFSMLFSGLLSFVWTARAGAQGGFGETFDPHTTHLPRPDPDFGPGQAEGAGATFGAMARRAERGAPRGAPAPSAYSLPNRSRFMKSLTSSATPTQITITPPIIMSWLSSPLATL